MDKLVIKKYTPAFKAKVISELESGIFTSMEQAQMHYNIGGSSTIKRWIVKAGKTKVLLPKVVVVDVDKETIS